MKENRYLQWLSGETASIYWHDSAIPVEVEQAIGNGARGMTTNPFLCGATLKAAPEYWREQLSKLPKGLKGDEKAEALLSTVIRHYAEYLKPFRAEGFGKGYCCAQTNPSKPGDARYMLEQAKRYAAIAPNVVVKIPATRSGIEAIEECAALGYNVAATVSFTVPQVLAVAEAVQRGFVRARNQGIAPGLAIAVLMVGRLDDYLRDVMQDTKAAASESDVIWAGTAAIKRAYQIFNERKYECVLMPAGCRGAHHITELAGAKMIMSVAPKIANQLEKLEEERFVERINAEIDSEIIDRLMSMPEFRKAYEPDGMQPDDFITYGSCNRTLDQFVNDGWNVLNAISYESI